MSTSLASREVLAVRYGTRETHRSELFLDYASYGEPDAPAVMDYFFWIVREGTRTMLVDTGFDPTVGARRGRTCLCPPVEALARLGITADAVEQIVLTHLHYDHTGNLDAFPNAAVFVPPRELEFWTGPEGFVDENAQHIERHEVEAIAKAASDGRIRTLDEATDLGFGVSNYLVGGHSPGQQVLVVESATGPVVLATDALHYYEELDRDRPFSIVVDIGEMRAGYRLLARLAARPGARLVAGHDPEVLERFPTDLEGLVVRVA